MTEPKNRVTSETCARHPVPLGPGSKPQRPISSNDTDDSGGETHRQCQSSLSVLDSDARGSKGGSGAERGGCVKPETLALHKSCALGTGLYVTLPCVRLIPVPPGGVRAPQRDVI